MVSGVSMESTRRITAQPCKVAARYFSASFMKPRGVRCRPRFHTPPSISISRRASSHAKSARQRRLLSKRYSRTSSGPPMASHRVANRLSSSELLRLSDTPLGDASKDFIDKEATTQIGNNQSHFHVLMRIIRCLSKKIDNSLNADYNICKKNVNV